MRLFAGERMQNIAAKLSEEEVPIEFGVITKGIERAQTRIEGNNFQRRKHVLEYDDVMNQQRKIIYKQRNEVLHGADVHGQIVSMIEGQMTDMAAASCQGPDATLWLLEDLCGELNRLLHQDVSADSSFTPETFQGCRSTAEVAERAIAQAQLLYDERAKLVQAAGYPIADLERMVLLRVVDSHWMDHIDAMDQLRDGIGLRGYGHSDPIIAYKQEGFDMFDGMIMSIREQTVSTLFSVRVGDDGAVNAPRARQQGAMVAGKKGDTLTGVPKAKAAPTATAKNATPVRAEQKTGRNDPCPCGSGKKFKNCCEGKAQG